MNLCLKSITIILTQIHTAIRHPITISLPSSNMNFYFFANWVFSAFYDPLRGKAQLAYLYLLGFCI